MELMWLGNRDTCMIVYSHWDAGVDGYITSAIEIDPLIVKVQLYNGVCTYTYTPRTVFRDKTATPGHYVYKCK